ncbi:MAG: hypothetical protein Q9181_000740 [Wetmoreana brouardii]
MENRFYHWCSGVLDYVYENGEPVIDQTTVPPPPMPSPCKLCEEDDRNTKWEFEPNKHEWFHWCNRMHAFCYANGKCDVQSTLEPEEDPNYAHLAKLWPCKDCTLGGHEPYWRHDHEANMRPGFIWRTNTSQRRDNCAWVTLARLLMDGNEVDMDTSALYKELAKVGISLANLDRPAAPKDVLDIADQFGAIQKITFTDGGSPGIRANELPSRGVPPQKTFATAVRIGNRDIGHVVTGYWAPPTSGSPASSTPWFRFMDYQKVDPGKDVTSWIMEQDKLVKYVYWFDQGYT